MNNILMDGNIITSNNIDIKGTSTIYINNISENINLNINMLDNSELTILDFNLSNKETNINIIQSNNTKVNYIHTFKINGDYKFNYVSDIRGNNNINNINIKGITSGNVTIYVDAISHNGTKDNEINENVRVLNLGGKVISKPMLHISSLEIIANHNTAISNINENELFYLNSKGISEMGAINLIQDGYLYGYFKEYEEFYKLIK